MCHAWRRIGETISLGDSICNFILKSQVKLNLGSCLFKSYLKYFFKKPLGLLEYLNDVSGIKHDYTRNLLTKYVMLIKTFEQLRGIFYDIKPLP